MHPDKVFIFVDDKRVSLTAFAKMDKSKIKTVDARGCTALTELKADAAKTVYARGCTALTELKASPGAKIERGSGYFFAGVDSRDYTFEAIVIRGQWRVIAGCHNLSIEDAIEHWAIGGVSDRADCRAMVEKIIIYTEARTKHVKDGAVTDFGQDA